MKPTILIVDDEKPTRDVMARALGNEYLTLTAEDGPSALTLLTSHPETVALLTDYRMPGMNGIELIVAAKKLLPHLGTAIITACAEVTLAVEAMKNGADDFLTKPIVDLNQLENTVSRIVKVGNVLAKEPTATAKSIEKTKIEGFIGESPEMHRLFALLRRVAPTTATVLIEGESGTGKELVAKALHQFSPRAEKPFIAIECSAFSEDLLKSELFGYEPGTFTGALKEGKAGCIEAAQGGTLFLDEIGEIDTATQIALLRTLENKSIRRLGSTRELPVDFRLIAATNRDLKAMVKAGKFREDLFFRLNIINLKLPPLRERLGDIEPLARHFLAKFADEHHSPARSFSDEALASLKNYRWPGNVREFRNIVERAVVLATNALLTPADLPSEITQGEDLAAPTLTPPTIAATPNIKSLADSEKQQILSTIERFSGNKSKAAEALGISRRTLHRKLKEWNCL